MSRRFQKQRQTRARRLVGLSVLLAFVGCLLPIPVIVPLDGELDSSAPYPCQHHHCGCLSAEQCWRKCCCFTHTQKLAWAKSHGVQPPEFVVIAAAQEGKATPCSGSGCCSSNKLTKSKATKAKSATSQVLTSKAACCQAAGSGKTCPQPSGEAAAPSTQLSYAIGIRAQECQGQVWDWSQLPWSILPPPLQVDWQPVRWDTWPRPVSDPAARSMSEPPVPPPRIAGRSEFVA